MSSSACSFKWERKKCSILFFIEDKAFPLGENLMKVYPGQHPKADNSFGEVILGVSVSIYV
jgi:hypothetical protein